MLFPFFSVVDYFQKNPCPFISVVEKHVCTDVNHLEKFFQDVVDTGGEGVILRDPVSPYQPGRCPGYLKHKVYSSKKLHNYIGRLINYMNSEIQGCRS